MQKTPAICVNVRIPSKSQPTIEMQKYCKDRGTEQPYAMKRSPYPLRNDLLARRASQAQNSALLRALPPAPW